MAAMGSRNQEVGSKRTGSAFGVCGGMGYWEPWAAEQCRDGWGEGERRCQWGQIELCRARRISWWGRGLRGKASKFGRVRRHSFACWVNLTNQKVPADNGLVFGREAGRFAS